MSKNKAIPQYVDVAEFLAAPGHTVERFLQSKYSAGNYITVTQAVSCTYTVTVEDPSSSILALEAEALCETLPPSMKALATFRPAGGNKPNVGRSEVTIWISSGELSARGPKSLTKATLIVNIMAEAQNS